MTDEDKFLKQIDEHDDIDWKLVPAKWPFDYNNNKGYLVSKLDRKEKLYFYFNNEGQLLEKKIIK